jgi:hypothetical protein
MKKMLQEIHVLPSLTNTLCQAVAPAILIVTDHTYLTAVGLGLREKS